MFPAINSDLAFYLAVGFFVVVGIFGLPAALRVWNDTREGVEPETDTPEDLLTPLAEAFHSGQMSEEEYERIRTSVERVLTPLEDSPLPFKERVVPKALGDETSEESIASKSRLEPPDSVTEAG